MKSLRYILLSALLINNIAYAKLHILDLDKSGNEIVNTIDEAEYTNILHQKLETAEVVVQDQLSNTFASPNLTLKGILIGLEAFGNVGIGPFKVGAAVNQQFYFEITK